MLACLDLTGELRFTHDGFEFNDGAKPEHNFDVQARLRRYDSVDKLAYLERDPRDVMLSLFHQVTGRFKNIFDYQGSLSDFIRDDYFGAANLQKFREIWDSVAGSRNYFTLRYEECHSDSATVLSNLVKYYGFEASPADVSSAALKGNFNAMKAVEEADAFPAPWLRVRNNHPKMRSGKIGGYASAFSESDQRYLRSIFHLREEG